MLSPVLFIPVLDQTLPIERAAQAIAATVPLRAPKQVVIVSSPLDILSVHVSTLLAEDTARTLPQSLHQLYTGASRLAAKRIGARTLELVADDGWGETAFERTLSTAATMPRVGSELALESIHVIVVASMSDGRPKRGVREHDQFVDPPTALQRASLGTMIIQATGRVEPLAASCRSTF